MDSEKRLWSHEVESLGASHEKTARATEWFASSAQTANKMGQTKKSGGLDRVQLVQFNVDNSNERGWERQPKVRCPSSNADWGSSIKVLGELRRPV